MGDYNVSFWGPEQNKIKKLREKSTPKVGSSMTKSYPSCVVACYTGLY